MATTIGGAGVGRAAATGIAGRVGLAARGTAAAGKAGELAGITVAAFPGQYAQEVDQLKELGMQDGTGLRLLAGGTAAITGLVEGIVPNPFGTGKVPLTEGAVKAARQYLWEAAKRAPGEMSEEYLQGVTSGLGKHVAQYLDDNAEEKTIADAFETGWEQAKEAALPMAFLLGVPALGGAGLSSARAQRLTRLQEIRANGPVSRKNGRELGIEGNQGERTAIVDAEISQLEQEATATEQSFVPPVTAPLSQGALDETQVQPNEESPLEKVVVDREVLLVPTICDRIITEWHIGQYHIVEVVRRLRLLVSLLLDVGLWVQQHSDLGCHGIQLDTSQTRLVHQVTRH